MIAEEISNIFKKYDVKWHFQEGQRRPTTDDIGLVLRKLANALKDEPFDTQMEVGRIIMKNNYGHLDTYLFLGEYEL